MQKDLEKYTNQARFVQMIIDGKLVVSKKKKAILILELKEKNFKPIPKISDSIKQGELAPIADNDEEEEEVDIGASAYDYLLGVSSIPDISWGPAESVVDAYLVVDQGEGRKAAQAGRRCGV